MTSFRGLYACGFATIVSINKINAKQTKTGVLVLDVLVEIITPRCIRFPTMHI